MVTKKQSSKEYAVRVFSFSNSKVVFTLQIKAISFHEELTTIHVWGPNFQGLFTRFIVNRNLSFLTAFKICCRSSSVYLSIKGLIELAPGLTMGQTAPLLFDPADNEGSEEVSEMRFLWGQSRPQTEVILIVRVKQSGVNLK